MNFDPLFFEKCKFEKYQNLRPYYVDKYYSSWAQFEVAGDRTGPPKRQKAG